jgi:hypothetical protein
MICNWSALLVPKMHQFLDKEHLVGTFLRAYNSSNFFHKVRVCVSSMIWFKTLSSTHYRMNLQACRWSTSYWSSFISSGITLKNTCFKYPLHTTKFSSCSSKLDHLYHLMISLCWYSLPSFTQTNALNPKQTLLWNLSTHWTLNSDTNLLGQQGTTERMIENPPMPVWNR